MTYSKIQYRPATNDDDEEGAVHLIFDIWKNEQNFQFKDKEAPDLDNIQYYYFSKGGAFYVAHHEDEGVIGTLGYFPLSHENTYAIKRMYIKKKYRRRGVAQGLMDYLHAHIARPSCLYLDMSTQFGKAAQIFYKKNKFQVIEKKELPHDFEAFSQSDVFFKKHL